MQSVLHTLGEKFMSLAVRSKGPNFDSKGEFEAILDEILQEAPEILLRTGRSSQSLFRDFLQKRAFPIDIKTQLIHIDLNKGLYDIAKRYRSVNSHGNKTYTALYDGMDYCNVRSKCFKDDYLTKQKHCGV